MGRNSQIAVFFGMELTKAQIPNYDLINPDDLMNGTFMLQGYPVREFVDQNTARIFWVISMIHFSTNFFDLSSSVTGTPSLDIKALLNHIPDLQLQSVKLYVVPYSS